MATRRVAVVAVGQPGAGKTTLLKRLFPSFPGKVSSSASAVTKEEQRTEIAGVTVIDTPGEGFNTKNVPVLHGFTHVRILVVAALRYADVMTEYQEKWPRYADAMLLVRSHHVPRPAYDEPHGTAFADDLTCDAVLATLSCVLHDAPQSRKKSSSCAHSVTESDIRTVSTVTDGVAPSWSTLTTENQAIKVGIDQTDIVANRAVGDAFLALSLERKGIRDIAFRGNAALCRFLDEHFPQVRNMIEEAFESTASANGLHQRTIGDGVEAMFAWSFAATEKSKQRVSKALMYHFLEWAQCQDDAN